jgi:two-component system, chemotaxis family, CheB/CheR fusion protein
LTAFTALWHGEPVSPAPRPTSATSRLQGRRVLIVEDHADSLEAFRQMVETFGATPILARTGEEALDRLGDDPDVILLDLMLPGLDGFEVADRLKTTNRTARIPIIAVTALDDATALTRTWAFGFAAHLAKPITVDQLKTVLERVLGDPGRPDTGTGPFPSR